jgi:hypothetical protein
MMKKFDEWLSNRDRVLTELLSQEELMSSLHNADKYATEKTEQQRRMKQAQDGIAQLDFIINNLENWVDHQGRGMEKIKWIAALFQMHDQDVKMQGSLEDTIASDYVNKFKDLQSVRSALSAENIVRHLGNLFVIKSLKNTIQKDWDTELLPKIILAQGKKPLSDQSFGDYGKNFAHHVTSMIYHTAQELKKGLEKNLKDMIEKDQPKPKPVAPVKAQEPVKLPMQKAPMPPVSPQEPAKTDFSKAFTFKDGDK